MATVNNKIQLWQGNESTMPLLLEGMLAFASDTRNVWIGSSIGNIKLGQSSGGGHGSVDADIIELLNQHEALFVASEEGVHGLRYYLNSWWVKEDDVWTEIEEEIPLPPPTKPPIITGDGVYMALGHNVTPFISVWKLVDNVWQRLPDPSVLPTGLVNDVSWSPDGKFLVCGHNATPYISVYEKIDDVLTKRTTNIANVGAAINCCSFSLDGNYLAIGFSLASSQMFHVYMYDRPNSQFVRIPHPAAGLPGTNAYVMGLTWSPDSQHLALAFQNQVPRFAIYRIANNLLSKLDVPDADLGNHGRHCAYSRDGKTLVFTHDGIPGITVFKRNGDEYHQVTGLVDNNDWNGRGVAVSDDGETIICALNADPFLGILKRGSDAYSMISKGTIIDTATQANQCSFTPDGLYLAATHQTLNRISVFKRDENNQYKLLVSPLGISVFPTAIAYACEFSPDGKYLVIGLAASPWVWIYERNGDIFTKLADLSLLPAGTVNDCKWTEDGEYFALGGATTPYVNVYKKTITGGITSFNRLTIPESRPANTINRVAWSTVTEVGRFLICSVAGTSPFYKMYRLQNDLLIDTALTTLPTGDSYGCVFSPDGAHVLISHANAATSNVYRISVWRRSGTSFTKLANLTTFLRAEVQYDFFSYSMRFSADGSVLYATNGRNLFMFRRDGNLYFFMGYAMPMAPSGVTIFGIALTPDDKYLAACYNTSAPWIGIWEKTRDSFENIGTPSVVPIGAAGKVDLFDPSDASVFALPHAGIPYISLYKSGFESMRKQLGPSFLPTANAMACAITQDGKFAAVGAGGTYPLIVYKKDDGQWIQFPTVGASPSAIVYSLAFSSDGIYLAAGSDATPYLTIYKLNAPRDAYERLPNVYSVPNGAVRGICWSPDDKYLLLATFTSRIMTIYKRVGDDFERLANPYIMPGGNAYSCAWSHNGRYVMIGTDTAPFLYAYEFTVDPIETFTRLLDPESQITGQAKSIAFSSDDRKVAVGINYDPFIALFDFNYGVLLRISDVDTGLPALGNGAVFSQRGELIMAHNATPFMSLYKPGYHSFRRIGQPDAIMAGSNYRGSFSPDGQFYAVGGAIAPFLIIYRIVGEMVVKFLDPNIMPTTAVNDVAFSPDGKHLAIAHQNAPYISVYHFDGSMFIRLETPTWGLAGATAAGNGVAWSPDGLHIACSFNATTANYPCRILRLYNNSLGWLLTPDASNQAAAACSRGSYSPDGKYLFWGCTADPFYIMFRREGDTYKKYQGLNSNPGGNCLCGHFSADGIYLSLVHVGTPFIRVYKFAGHEQTYPWVNMGQPAADMLPTGNTAQHCEFSPDGRFLACVGQSPAFILYNRINDRFVKMPRIYPAIPIIAYGVTFNKDSSLIAINCSVDPFVMIFKIEYNSMRRAMQPYPLPRGNGNAIAVSGDGSEIMLAHTGLNYLSIYDYKQGEGYEVIQPPPYPEPSGNGMSVGFYLGNNLD